MIKMNPESGYEWVTASISGGDCCIRYRAIGLSVDGNDSLDEDVSEWKDDDIRQTVGMMIDVPEKHRKDIEIEWD